MVCESREENYGNIYSEIFLDLPGVARGSSDDDDDIKQRNEIFRKEDFPVSIK